LLGRILQLKRIIIILTFTFKVPRDQYDTLIAILSDLPFDAFEEQEESIVSAVSEKLWTKEAQLELDRLQSTFQFQYEKELGPVINWNAIWESKFREIIIDDFCRVRAPFHQSDAKVEYDIVIDPRMAFGTGHHETTRLMIQSMRKLNIGSGSFLDFGSGSGILAILARKMGAEKVDAIEIDEHACVNLRENVVTNMSPEIEVLCQGHLENQNDESFDVVLANITRNILLDHEKDLKRILKPGGFLVLSGFMEHDHQVVLDGFTDTLQDHFFLQENEWIAQTFRKEVLA